MLCRRRGRNSWLRLRGWRDKLFRSNFGNFRKDRLRYIRYRLVNWSARFNSGNSLKQKITFLCVLPLNVIFGEKRLIFKEGDIQGDMEFLGNRGITLVPFLCRGISKEKTFVGFRVKFAHIIVLKGLRRKVLLELEAQGAPKAWALVKWGAP